MATLLGLFHVFVTPGVTAAGQIGAADCTDDYGDPTHKLDTYLVRMVAGTTYTMTLTTTGAQWVSLWAPTDSGTYEIVKGEGTGAAGTATLTFTATRTGLHYVYTGGTPGPTYQLAFAGTPAASPRRVRATSAAAGSAPLAAPRRTAPARGPRMQ